jgi:hypothetical protein
VPNLRPSIKLAADFKSSRLVTKLPRDSRLWANVIYRPVPDPRSREILHPEVRSFLFRPYPKVLS